MASQRTRYRFRDITLSVWCCLLYVGIVPAAADESHARYFDQLRRRGLFSLAEGYAISRLSQAGMPLSVRTDWSIELSRTLAEHAGFASDEQQAELWKRAKTTVDDELSRDPSNPRRLLLSVQSAMVLAAEAAWLRVECEIRPYDESLATRTRQTCTQAIDAFLALEQRLGASGDASTGKRLVEGSLNPHDMRIELHRVRFQLANTLRGRAELWPADSGERSVDLVESESFFRKLVGVADDPLPLRSKLGLAICARLKGETERSHEMLNALEKFEPRPADDLLDEIVAERARLLLQRHQAADAAELIVQTRSKRKRLTGELWLLQVRALTAMRDAALQRKDQVLADQLREQAEVTLRRCDEQVGGFWSRRCHLLWESTRTAEKYGPALDATMQQARADFLAGRTETALKGYAAAERSAATAGQPDLAADLAYTRASILLQDKQFEAAAKEFLRIAREYPKNARAAAAHLNGAYCLGRHYEEKKTQARREAYTEKLDQQIELFPDDPTANDARFFRAQLEEQRLQASAALPLYLQIDATHPRAAEARAGAARCFEAILIRMRERKLDTAAFERDAIEKLSEFASASEEGGEWSAPQAEVALHLAALLLMADVPRFNQADRLLSPVIRNAGRIDEKDEQFARWNRLRQRAGALRVVSLAGSGHPLEAERLVSSLAAAAPRDLLAIVERLTPFVQSTDRQRQAQYVELQLRAAEYLNAQRKELGQGDLDRLDRCLAGAYLANGQVTKAVEIYGRLATNSSKDAGLQREIATVLEAVGHHECLTLARQCWRRVESLTRQGTEEWLAARLGVISSSHYLNQTAEARKLLNVTKLLYPELGSHALKTRFTMIEREMDSSDTKRKFE